MSRLGSYQGLGARRTEVENLSTASTRNTLTDSQQDRLLIAGGWSSGAAIVLPQPEAGMQYRIFFGIDATSAATRFVGNTAGSDVYFFSTAGAETTAAAVAFQSTQEGGAWIEFTGLSDVRWAVTGMPGTTLAGLSLASTTT